MSETHIPTWDECLDAGMTAREAAEARGCSEAAAYLAARKRKRKFVLLKKVEIDRPVPAAKPVRTTGFSTSPEAIERYLAKSAQARREVA